MLNKCTARSILAEQVLDENAKLDGEVAEWSNAPHLKCGVEQSTASSNPAFSAKNKEPKAKALGDYVFAEKAGFESKPGDPFSRMGRARVVRRRNERWRMTSA